MCSAKRFDPKNIISTERSRHSVLVSSGFLQLFHQHFENYSDGIQRGPSQDVNEVAVPCVDEEKRDKRSDQFLSTGGGPPLEATVNVSGRNWRIRRRRINFNSKSSHLNRNSYNPRSKFFHMSEYL